MRILVVDDDPSVREALSRVLRHEGFAVAVAEHGAEAMSALTTAEPDAVLLDVMMPGLDGLSVCRRARAAGLRTPILMLTARDEVGDRVAGLESGADDYLPKPFALEELLARLKALLRRSDWAGDGDGEGARGEDGVLAFEDVRLDRRSFEVHRGARRLTLTRTEYLLLEMLLEHPRQALTRTAIFERVWNYDFGPDSNSLQVYVGYLRRKLEAEGERRIIHTIRGVGYILREP